MIYLIVLLAFGLIMIIMAFTAIHHKNLQVAVIASGIISLLASVIYVFLAAPDVAITEASIGSALTIVIFFYVLNKIRHSHDQE